MTLCCTHSVLLGSSCIVDATLYIAIKNVGLKSYAMGHRHLLSTFVDKE